ncbi:MAG: YjbQ family protein, partial [Alphaproteobacteria bacterium]|nr:YjbQ family protein [Alphaproteobacteria bacterium]
KECIQRLLDRAAHHLSQMIPDPSLVDLDHLAHRSLTAHRLLLHSRRSHHSRKCERFCTLSTALTQVQLSIPVTGGRMALGTWQGIYLFEHRRRPHRRELVLHLLGE